VAETVIATYEEWLEEREKRRRRKLLGVTVYVDLQVVAAGGRGQDLWSALQQYAPITVANHREDGERERQMGGGGGALEAHSAGGAGADSTADRGAPEGGGLLTDVGMCVSVKGAGGGEEEADEAGQEGEGGRGGGYQMYLLIQQSLEAKEAWNRTGGIFIHFDQHTLIEDVVSRSLTHTHAHTHTDTHTFLSLSLSLSLSHSLSLTRSLFLGIAEFRV
jgi:hypothetical protein